MNHFWFRCLAQVAPWLTFLLLVVMFYFFYGTLAPAPALSFSLPASGVADSAQPGLIALMLPGDSGGAQTEGTLVYFDDARYVLSDPVSMEEFAGQLGDRAAEMKYVTLTLLADRRVPVGDVMKVMAIAKSRRLEHVQLAERRD